ncbi:MAG: ABC transporter ATP-binding protein/permease [Anaeromicrobium sp.]|jgi:ATP-binding cassette subfamily B protein|uniref:ABC transporter ATP-binding protein n=1 Tax=Anaeromicrobium sp. TaxID=1929132 RepID=UPI0025ED9417|nr:ABC transporter ATP-binding protein [Anaeromicrobium sp.]MCT4595798.1 ABC transporter ATP-binding protein/permease [Anaeromicrobium sp.]
MVKKFISYYRPYTHLLILDLSASLIVSLVNLAFPAYSRKIINNIIPNNEIDKLFNISLLMIGLFILKGLCNYIINYWGHVLGVRIEHDMRRDLFKHLQSLSFKYYDNNKIGHLMCRIVNDLHDVAELAHHGPEDLFLSSLMIIGSFIILININVFLTLVVFSFIPILLIYAINKRKKMSRAFKREKKEIAKVNAQVQDSLLGIRVSTSFNNQLYEMKKFNKENLEFKKAREKSFSSMATLMGGIFFLINILRVVVLVLGGYLVMIGTISHGDLVAYLLYTGFFIQPIRRISQFTQQYESAMAGFHRFHELMSIKSHIKDHEHALPLEKCHGHIEFKNASFSYDEENYVLKGINLKVNKGETLAIVGPSGVGKTTLCNLIPRFYELSHGDILIDNNSLKNYTLNSLRSHIGIVDQDIFLFTSTIYENIHYGNLNSSYEDVIQAAKLANIHDYIISLDRGYDTYIGEGGIQLSGGQRQRIAIARVFLKNPSILILDEATSSLDSENQSILENSLKELSSGKTTLIIAHRLSTIKNAHRIVVLNNNQVEEIGTHHELINNNGLYKNLYDLEFKSPEIL